MPFRSPSAESSTRDCWLEAFGCHPFGSTCVHAEVMPSPCCPPPPLIDGCVKSQAILLQQENCAKGNLCQGLTLHQPTQTLLRTMILRLANPSSSSPRTDVTLAPPHLPIPAPSPFVLHRDFPLRGPCAVSLLLASWRTWTDRTPTHQILRQFSNVIFIKNI